MVWFTLSLSLVDVCLQGTKYYPMSYPTMPKDEILENQQLQKSVIELAAILEVRSLFYETMEADW